MIIKKINFFFVFINRFKRVFFSFQLKENLAEKLVYGYFSFFGRFHISNFSKFIISFLSKFTRFKNYDLFNVQNKRLVLKNDFKKVFNIKKKILKKNKLQNKIDNDLKKNGFVNIDHICKIDEKDTKKFLSELNNLKYFNSQVPLQSDLKETYPTNDSNYYSLRPNVELPTKYYRKILNNKKVVRLIENYLGSKPYLYSINTMLTKPSQIKHSVTNLHRDYDDYHFIVLLIYWTKVNRNNGATFFIPKSHLNNNKNINDGVYLEGDSGSVYLVDTFGWHSGNKNLKNDRVVSWLRFSKNQLNIASYDNKEYFFFNYYNSLIK